MRGEIRRFPMDYKVLEGKGKVKDKRVGGEYQRLKRRGVQSES